MSGKLANGATVTIGTTTYSDAVSIQVPGKEYSKIDVTNLGSDQVEYEISEIFDQPEITITVPMGTFPAMGNTKVAFAASYGDATISNTYCKVIACIPKPFEVNGKMEMDIKILPCP